jgi:hypothetical protein
MPQLLFLAGMTITIGVQATVQFFSRRKNRKVGTWAASSCSVVPGAARQVDIGTTNHQSRQPDIRTCMHMGARC